MTMSRCCQAYFNPRTREGCDFIFACIRNSFLPFQSTHPRRVRQYIFLLFELKPIFQSTHPRRVRRGFFQPFDEHFFFISIHAPAKGATAMQSWMVSWVVYFNPRTREGCDMSLFVKYTRFIISIHAPAKGATRSLIRHG